MPNDKECGHDSIQTWTIYGADGGAIAIDNSKLAVIDVCNSIEWCSRCGSIHLGQVWHKPQNE
jgi:hypothetical protein